MFIHYGLCHPVPFHCGLCRCCVCRVQSVPKLPDNTKSKRRRNAQRLKQEADHQRTEKRALEYTGILKRS